MAIYQDLKIEIHCDSDIGDIITYSAYVLTDGCIAPQQIRGKISEVQRDSIQASIDSIKGIIETVRDAKVSEDVTYMASKIADLSEK